MDKNTIIGLVLIMIVIFGFSWLNRPSKEQLEQARRERDSIEYARQLDEFVKTEEARVKAEMDSVEALNPTEETMDKLTQLYGELAPNAVGKDSLFEVSNGKIALTFSAKGGNVVKAQVLDYYCYDSLPMYLFTQQSATQYFELRTASNRIIKTSNLFFEPYIAQNDSEQVVTMCLRVDSVSHLDFVYIIPNDDYMTRTEIRAENMESVLGYNSRELDMHFDLYVRQNERGRKFESRYATLNYKYVADDMEKLSETKSDSERASGSVRWIAFKDHFFSTITIADNEGFSSTEVASEVLGDDNDYIKHHSFNSTVAFDPRGEKATMLRTYYGPNKYKTLKAYDHDVERADRLGLQYIIPMGWKIFRWISTGIIIPIFNFLEKYIASYGIIILLMTLIIKIVIFPFTYKSYMSSAKMRVLKPQIDEINARIPADKAMERQQATMELYNKVGVSPMSGCLPMLFQMPILFAMFAFFPTAFELRGQSFLWAKDLSSFDAIVSWDAYIPLITPWFGNHISLFCLLMTITNIIYTKINLSTTNTEGQPGGQMMKWMMYLMPVMFMFMFNNYASGLSYYYFVSLLITIIQTTAFRFAIKEEKILAKLESKKNSKTQKKKSRFMQRLEAAQKEQQRMIREQSKKQMSSNSKGRH